VQIGKAKKLCVALATRGRVRLEHHAAASNVHDRERMGVTVRVDTDHVVQIICKHPFRPPAQVGGTTPAPVWR